MEQLQKQNKNHNNTEMCCKNEIEKIAERVQNMLQKEKEQKEKSSNIKTEYDTKAQEIEYLPICPNRPIKEGECPICRGLGVVKAVIDGVERWGNCVCVKENIAMEQLQRTGIAESIKKYTFDSFQTPEEWQEVLKQSALQFLNEKEKWFFVGGQVGCGKTHICTAIVGELFKRGKTAKYMLWTNEIVKLKANKMNAEEYQRLIEPFLTTEVLYIDDFFKTEKGKSPSESDIKTAFEIINYRYVNSNLITILSCEKTIGELMEIDEAVGSRIYQKTKEYGMIISRGKDRNWRMRKEK